MTNEQIEQLRALIVQWRKEEYWEKRDFGKDFNRSLESAYQSCADALEEVLQSFNQDEES